MIFVGLGGHTAWRFLLLWPVSGQYQEVAEQHEGEGDHRPAHSVHVAGVALVRRLDVLLEHVHEEHRQRKGHHVLDQEAPRQAEEASEEVRSAAAHAQRQTSLPVTVDPCDVGHQLVGTGQRKGGEPLPDGQAGGLPALYPTHHEDEEEHHKGDDDFPSCRAKLACGTYTVFSICQRHKNERLTVTHPGKLWALRPNLGRTGIVRHVINHRFTEVAHSVIQSTLIGRRCIYRPELPRGIGTRCHDRRQTGRQNDKRCSRRNICPSKPHSGLSVDLSRILDVTPDPGHTNGFHEAIDQHCIVVDVVVKYVQPI
mmetsp:Transcript_139792/g.243375  ORF Transcript_139792/g.243375 Transcript_139792/m.243375 type:complete len:312 (+) Transcript_139792:334-1269(+)